MGFMKDHLRLARHLMILMDTRFTFLGFRFGIDPLLDFLPGVGSAIGAAVSCYLFWIAYQLQVPRWVYARMAWHIFLDFFLGELPVVGFLFDALYHSNEKNWNLLSQFADPEVLIGEVISG